MLLRVDSFVSTMVAIFMISLGKIEGLWSHVKSQASRLKIRPEILNPGVENREIDRSSSGTSWVAFCRPRMTETYEVHMGLSGRSQSPWMNKSTM